MMRNNFFQQVVAYIADHMASASPHVLAAAADAAIKGAIILALVGLATLAMRRSSAAARHLAWFTGTLSLLLLPIVSLLVPGWYVLPTWTGAAAINVAQPQPTEQAAQTASQPIPAANDIQPQALAPAADPSASPIETTATSALPSKPASAPVAPATSISWHSAVLLVWLAGCVALLAQFAIGLLSLAWLRHRSSRITSGNLLAAVREISDELGVRRPIELLTSSRRAMPMIWGLWHIHVLLPAEAADWSAEQCRVVLLHELAHARRFDCQTQTVAQLACALFWFNPLVWLARWRMQIDREQACDDLVLASGTRASAYAEQLVRIAAQMPTPHYSAAAIAMARPSTLESRVRAILDPTRNRRRLAAGAAILLIVAVGTCAVALAALRAEVRPDPPPGFGRIVDVQGRPVVGATLTDGAAKWSAASGTDGLFPLPRIQHPHQFGQFNLTVEAVGFARRDDVMLLFDPSGALLEQSLLVDVSKRPTEERGIIELQRRGRVEGRVLGPNGKPLAAAPVQLDVKNYFDGVMHYIGSAASTATDANGRFTIENVLPGELLLHYPGSNVHPPIKSVGAGLRATLADGQSLKGVVLDLSKSTAGATGRVVDKTGIAVSGAEVAFVWDNGGGWTRDPWPDAISKTDDRGQFRLARLPPGDWHIVVSVGTTYFDPVPVTLLENHVSTADVVLPVVHTSVGRLRRVQPMGPTQTVREWIDATLAGDSEGVRAVVAPDSPFDRNSIRIGSLLKQIKDFTSDSTDAEARQGRSNDSIRSTSAAASMA